jgi:hypothetical protein
MTTLREAAQQALEALKSCSAVPHWPALQPTITALRDALAQQEQERATLVAAAEREKLANWMWSLGYATHGDTIEEMLDHLGTQIAERLLTEREARAKVCETTDEPLDSSAAGGVFATAIRARENK